MQAAIDFFKKETVLVIAIFLAVISMFFVKPDGEYAGYIDYQTLALLFSLMIIMAQFQKIGVFDYIGVKLLQRITRSRQLYAALVLLCFFSSMIITNDVALITFVPFAITVLKMADLETRIIPIIVMQTVAANLGSMVTPIGNPQNLYLYGQSGMSLLDFTMLMLPYAAISAVVFLLLIVRMKNQQLNDGVLQVAVTPRITAGKELMMYILLFIGCVLAVGKVIPWQLMLIMVIVITAKADIRIFRNIDYSLLMTFIAFFIFIGNIGRSPFFCQMFAETMQGNEVIASIAASQLISNVPAALLLSGFSTKWNMLIIGTNLGGLGTLIASMASLISYKQVVKHYPAVKSKYIQQFTITNIGFLTILLLTFQLMF